MGLSRVSKEEGVLSLLVYFSVFFCFCFSLHKTGVGAVLKVGWKNGCTMQHNTIFQDSKGDRPS
jgi:hypothetical protein